MNATSKNLHDLGEMMQDEATRARQSQMGDLHQALLSGQFRIIDSNLDPSHDVMHERVYHKACFEIEYTFAKFEQPITQHIDVTVWSGLKLYHTMSLLHVCKLDSDVERAVIALMNKAALVEFYNHIFTDEI